MPWAEPRSNMEHDRCVCGHYRHGHAPRETMFAETPCQVEPCECPSFILEGHSVLVTVVLWDGEELQIVGGDELNHDELSTVVKHRDVYGQDYYDESVWHSVPMDSVKRIQVDVVRQLAEEE